MPFTTHESSFVCEAAPTLHPDSEALVQFYEGLQEPILPLRFALLALVWLRVFGGLQITGLQLSWGLVGLKVMLHQRKPCSPKAFRV